MFRQRCGTLFKVKQSLHNKTLRENRIEWRFELNTIASAPCQPRGIVIVQRIPGQGEQVVTILEEKISAVRSFLAQGQQELSGTREPRTRSQAKH